MTQKKLSQRRDKGLIVRVTDNPDSKKFNLTKVLPNGWIFVPKLSSFSSIVKNLNRILWFKGPLTTFDTAKKLLISELKKSRVEYSINEHTYIAKQNILKLRRKIKVKQITKVKQTRKITKTKTKKIIPNKKLKRKKKVKKIKIEKQQNNSLVSQK